MNRTPDAPPRHTGAVIVATLTAVTVAGFTSAVAHADPPPPPIAGGVWGGGSLHKAPGGGLLGDR